MDDFKQWLARKLLNGASRLLQTERAYNARLGWMFDNNWQQPVRDFKQVKKPSLSQFDRP